MDKKDEKTEKEGSESAGSCTCGSCGCGRRCCSGKAALVLVLLLIGGLIGFSIGRCHSYRSACMLPYGHPMVSGMEAPGSK